MGKSSVLYCRETTGVHPLVNRCETCKVSLDVMNKEFKANYSFEMYIDKLNAVRKRLNLKTQLRHSLQWKTEYFFPEKMEEPYC